MKLDSIVYVDKPLKEVWEFLEDVDKMALWIGGFQRYKYLSGPKGRRGQVADHCYEEKGKQFCLRETLVERSPMKRVRIELWHSAMTSKVKVDFEPINENQTIVKCNCDITMTGAWKLIGPFMKKSFQARQNADYERLKAKCEAL